MKTKQVGRYKVDEFSYNCENDVCELNRIITFSIKSLFDNSIYYGKFDVCNDEKSFVNNKPIIEISWEDENDELVKLNIDYFTNYDEPSIYDILVQRANIYMSDYYVTEICL